MEEVYFSGEIFLFPPVLCNLYVFLLVWLFTFVKLFMDKGTKY